MSYINLESRDRSLKIQAFHTFPDDYAIVKSQSVFALPGKEISDLLQWIVHSCPVLLGYCCNGTKTTTALNLLTRPYELDLSRVHGFRIFHRRHVAGVGDFDELGWESRAAIARISGGLIASSAPTTTSVGTSIAGRKPVISGRRGHAALSGGDCGG